MSLAVSVSPTPVARGVSVRSSGFRLSELVKKIGTSGADHKKRIRKMRKKLRKVSKEHRRIAKERGLYATGVTLTYADSGDFHKKHITKFVKGIRDKLARSGYKLLYPWVLESASHIHYHLQLWLPRGFKLNYADLSRWWPHGSTWTEACKSVKAWAEYMAK